MTRLHNDHISSQFLLELDSSLLIIKLTKSYCNKKINKLKSLKVAKSKDDGGGAVDCSVDAGDMNSVLMLCVMVHVLVWVMVC